MSASRGQWSYFIVRRLRRTNRLIPCADIAVTCSAGSAPVMRSVPSSSLLRTIGMPPSRRESMVFGAGYVVQIPAFSSRNFEHGAGISGVGTASDFRFIGRTTGFAHRSARCCPSLGLLAVSPVLSLYFNGLSKCRSSNTRDICATFARKQP